MNNLIDLLFIEKSFHFPKKIEEEKNKKKNIEEINKLIQDNLFQKESFAPSEQPLFNWFNNVKHNSIKNFNKYFSSYYFLLKSLAATYKAILNNDWIQFDALVKENNCQVRAILITMIASKISNKKNKTSPHSLNIINKYEEKLNNIYRILKEIAQIFQNKDSLISFTLLKEDFKKNPSHSALLCEILKCSSPIYPEFKKYIIRKDWNIELNKKEIVLLLCFILSQLKVNGAYMYNIDSQQDKSNVKLLNKNVHNYLKLPASHCSENITSPPQNFFHDLELEYLCKLSKISVEFLQSAAIKLNDIESKRYTSEKFIAFKKKNKTYHYSQSMKQGINEIQSLPTFWSFYITFWSAFNKNIPIIIVLSHPLDEIQTKKNTLLHYRPNKDLKTYELVSSACISDNTASLVVHATTESTISQVTSFDLLELIFSYAATHKQYVDIENDKDILKFDVSSLVEKNSGQFTNSQDKIVLPNKPLFQGKWGHYIKKGIELGCTINNSKLFFILHVVCSTPQSLRGSIND